MDGGGPVSHVRRRRRRRRRGGKPVWGGGAPLDSASAGRRNRWGGVAPLLQAVGLLRRRVLLRIAAAAGRGGRHAVDLQAHQPHLSSAAALQYAQVRAAHGQQVELLDDLPTPAGSQQRGWQQVRLALHVETRPLHGAPQVLGRRRTGRAPHGLDARARLHGARKPSEPKDELALLPAPRVAEAEARPQPGQRALLAELTPQGKPQGLVAAEILQSGKALLPGFGQRAPPCLLLELPLPLSLPLRVDAAAAPASDACGEHRAVVDGQAM
mmetsp:Transcript_77178/g.243836  ORF Transcript_77178/g.243836 Transcript_77178/m.243836 type:complete len:269 (+) Transcript_77178:1216-2022(+)